MKNTFANLLNMIVSAYIGQLTGMYYWDRRADLAKGTDEASIYCKIRNEHAHEASGLYKILAEIVDENDITRYHEEAMKASKEM